jgi:hypothetical protein
MATRVEKNSTVSKIVKSPIFKGILSAVNTVTGLDASKFATFESLVASYGKHMRSFGDEKARIFVPVGSLLNYHPPNLDSHFSGKERTRAEKAAFFIKRSSELETGLKKNANKILSQKSVPLSYETIQESLENLSSFYIVHPKKQNEVVLYLTDSFIQSVAPTMGSASAEPIESVAVYLKNKVDKDHFIKFGQLDDTDRTYYLLDQADYHLILDGQNRYQIIKQVFTKLINQGFTINGKKINDIYIETLSYLKVPNLICDTGFKIRNKSASCGWFDDFPQSNVNKKNDKQPLNRDKKRKEFIFRNEIKKCGLSGVSNPSPFNNIKNEIPTLFDHCDRRQAK